MARVRKTIKVCDRCAFGRERPASATHSFAVDGTRYVIDLCEEHGDQLSRELLGWARLATVVEDAEPETRSVSRGHFTPERQRDARRAAEIRAAENAAVVRAAERAAIEGQQLALPEQPKPAPPKPKSNVLPFSAFGWELTDHARRRALARGFDVREVLTAAAQPEQTYRQPKYGEHAAIHQRGDIALAVDTRSQTVISVLHRTTERYAPTAHRSEIRRA